MKTKTKTLRWDITFIFILLIATICIYFTGCSDNPVNPINQNDSTLIFEQPIGELFTVNSLAGSSENYKDYNLGVISFINSDSLSINFEYLLINNEGLSGGNVFLFQGINGLFATSLLESDYKYKTFSKTFAKNELINSNQDVILRLVVQYNSLSLAVKNLKIYEQ